MKGTSSRYFCNQALVVWIFGVKARVLLILECFPGDFSECFLYFDSSKGKQDTSLIYRELTFLGNLLSEFSVLIPTCPVPCSPIRYTVLTREMATQNEGMTFPDPVQVGVHATSSRLCNQSWHVKREAAIV